METEIRILTYHEYHSKRSFSNVISQKIVRFPINIDPIPPTWMVQHFTILLFNYLTIFKECQRVVKFQSHKRGILPKIADGLVCTNWRKNILTFWIHPGVFSDGNKVNVSFAES